MADIYREVLDLGLWATLIAWLAAEINNMESENL